MVTRKSLYATAAFLVFELLVVGELGEWVAKRFGFDPSAFIPVTGLVWFSAGYVAYRFGGVGALAGAMVGGMEATLFWVMGGMKPADVPVGWQPFAGMMIVLVGIVGGGSLGALGEVVARWRERKATEQAGVP